MKRRLSNAYITMVILGVVFTGLTILMFRVGEPRFAAVLSVFAFIFLWVPQMFPDYDKYTYYRDDTHLN